MDTDAQSDLEAEDQGSDREEEEEHGSDSNNQGSNSKAEEEEQETNTQQWERQMQTNQQAWFYYKHIFEDIPLDMVKSITADKKHLEIKWNMTANQQCTHCQLHYNSNFYWTIKCTVSRKGTYSACVMCSKGKKKAKNKFYRNEFLKFHVLYTALHCQFPQVDSWEVSFHKWTDKKKGGEVEEACISLERHDYCCGAHRFHADWSTMIVRKDGTKVKCDHLSCLHVCPGNHEAL